MRYGVPVSQFLASHTSAELTELMALFWLQDNPQRSVAASADDPEQQSRLLKQALFKGG